MPSYNKHATISSRTRAISHVKQRLQTVTGFQRFNSTINRDKNAKKKKCSKRICAAQLFGR